MTVKENNMVINICLVGEGGQGVQTTGKLLAQIARQAGYYATYVPNYGVEQRGGSSIAFIRISNYHLDYPKFSSADHLFLLAKRSLPRAESLISSQTMICYNSDFANDNIKSQKNCFPYPLSSLANELGAGKYLSMLVLGLVLQKIKIVNIDLAAGEIEKYFSKKIGQEIIDNNKNALSMGFKL